MRKTLSVGLAFLLLLSSFPLFSVSAEKIASSGEASSGRSGYRDYAAQNRDIPLGRGEIVLRGADAVRTDPESEMRKGSFKDKDGVLIWESLGGYAEWEIDLTEDALYTVELTYYVLDPGSRNVEVGFGIDGKRPFAAAADISLPRAFRSEGKIQTDARGNHIRPEQVPHDIWMTSFLRDNGGLTFAPYRFRFDRGRHVLRLDGVRAGFALAEIRLCNPQEPPAYAEYAENARPVSGVETIFVEAEEPFYVTDAVLYPVYDRSGPDTSPSDPVKLRLNTLGQSNWSLHGQAVTWKIRVEKAGYYRIGLRFRQNLLRNLTVYRTLYINGETPFKEAETLSFPFADRWQTAFLADGALFRLDEGENLLTLEATPGPLCDLLARLDDIVFDLNGIYRDIIMVTGHETDIYRDYELEKEIPDLLSELKRIKKECEDLKSDLKKLNKRDTSATTSALNAVAVQIQSFLKKPETIALRVSRLQDNIRSLSALSVELKNQPLEIDYLSLAGDGEAFRPKSGFFRKAAYFARSFLGSFTEDYNGIGEKTETADSVNLWVNLGRDQTQVIKTMIDSGFTPKTGIPVNVSLVQQSLVQAALSGKGPDAVVFVYQNEPVNLAARGALMPLDEFDSFDAVAARFHPESTLPYRYKGNCYAIPVTEDFTMLFYRTDIFEELNLEAPKTWDEFYRVVSVLQRRNMTAGVPNMPIDNQMAANTGIFAMLLRQAGESYLKPDLSATNFDTPAAVEIFKMWTGFYADHGLPYQYDFFSRFRTGEMPVGLDSYTLFNKLTVGAPEIKGLWKMAPVPGMFREDGTADNSVWATGSSVIMFRRARNPENVWRFIDWFTSDEVQASFGLQMESLLGASGRYNTANRKAFEKLPWSYEEQRNIAAQWDKIFTVPQIPGGYFIDRNLTNAFRRVVLLHKNPRETLNDYNKEINAEIRRKNKEFE